MNVYELRESYAGTVEQPNPDDPKGPPLVVPYFTGGVISAGDRDIDVRAELDKGDGTIGVAEDDLYAIVALDAYPALKRTTPGTEPPAQLDERITGYDHLKADDLRNDPRLADVGGTAGARKAELVAALEELDARNGEPMPEQPPTIAQLVAAGEARAATTTNEEAPA